MEASLWKVCWNFLLNRLVVVLVMLDFMFVVCVFFVMCKIEDDVERAPKTRKSENLSDRELRMDRIFVAEK
jgi:hypothetical protein